jgi:hypothetical protein
MNEKFTWDEIREPPSIGSQTRAISSPHNLQEVIFCRIGVNFTLIRESYDPRDLAFPSKPKADEGEDADAPRDFRSQMANLKFEIWHLTF